MLKPAKMRKVRIIVLRDAVKYLIKALHKQGFMEIKKTKFPSLDDGRPLEFYNEVSEQLVKLRGVAALLEKHLKKKPDLGDNLLDGETAVEQSRNLGLSPVLKNLTNEASTLENEISTLSEQVKDVRKLLPFKGVNFSRLRTKHLNYRVGDIPPGKVLSLKQKLDKVLTHYNFAYPGGDDQTVALLLYEDAGKDIDNLLTEYDFKVLQPPDELTMPSTTLEKLNSELKAKKDRLAQISKELSNIAEESYSKVMLLGRSLKVAADRTEIASRFGFSKSTCTLEGWVPDDDYDQLKKTVLNFENQAMLIDVNFSHKEIPPTVLDNPTQAGPFEFLSKNYSLPNYYEIDPTMIYMLTVPLLLGMIVGDVIYGVLMVVTSLWLMKVFRKSYIMSNVSKIWYYSAFTTMLFGLIFDEWYGFHHIYVFKFLSKWGLTMPSSPIYTGLSRVHDLSLLIGITVLLGLVQLGIGFILGAINEWGHNKKHALAKIAWIGVEIGGTVAVCAMILKVLPVSYGIPSIILLAISALVLLVTEGLIGILEIPGLMGSALSYARIAAIGVVGVVLAEIINDYFAPTPDAGIFLIVLVPLFIVLHFVNMFIAMFEALIQGGRLNLIEFRSKFLKGGGSVFAPFSMKKEILR